jgi:hypothetical protein
VLGVRCSFFDIILRQKTPNKEHRTLNSEDVPPNSLQPNPSTIN